MAASYKKYLQLLEKWPIDKTKNARDLGLYLRQQVKLTFGGGVVSRAEEEKCERQLHALNRLADNTYGKLFSRTSTSTATGLSADQCRQILSTDFLELLQEEDKGMMSKIMSKAKPKT